MSEQSGQSVLLVDDSADIHRIVGVRLGSEKLELLHAYDAAEAMKIVRDELPDLILLDLDMPGTDGMALCKELKEDPDFSQIPVIFLTGNMDVETKVRAFDLGAVDYVTKPFDAIELKARVRASLRTKRYHDLLATKARIDALTGLWNRGYLNSQLAIEISVLKREGKPISLVMVDIDHFKSINDTHGHPAGDSILQTVGDIFNQACRESDVVCRYGGEEFAVILRHTLTKDAVILAERLRREVESSIFKPGNEELKITASFGITGSDNYPDATRLSADTLMETADRALYQAKTEGRNRVVLAGVLQMAAG